MGVRYITEDLIKKTAKQDNLALIIILNLTLSNDIGKKIKVDYFIINFTTRIFS